MSENMMVETAPAPTEEDRMLASIFPSMASDKPVAPSFSNALTEPDKPASDEPRSDAEMAQALYTNMHGVAARSIENAAMEFDAESLEQAKEIADSWVPHFNALQLSATESGTLAEVGISVHRTPPDDVTRQQWADEALAGIARDYGRENVHQLLEDTRKLINARPGLAQWLVKTGMGNHPKVVAIAVAKAREARKAGKLK